MDWHYDNGHVVGYMPDIDAYLTFDNRKEYREEYEKAKKENEKESED